MKLPNILRKLIRCLEGQILGMLIAPTEPGLAYVWSIYDTDRHCAKHGDCRWEVWIYDKGFIGCIDVVCLLCDPITSQEIWGAEVAQRRAKQ
jgi:hypothetical protein